MKPTKAFFDGSKFGDKKIREFFKDVAKESVDSERGMAIILAAYIEDVLNEILKKHLVSEKTYKKKFSRLSFDQLITWCYLAGLINEEIREDLDKIRDIRNKFAHKIDITSFNHQWVASRCNNFHALKVLNKVLPNVELRTAKEKYLSVATLYLGLLLEKTKSIKRIK